MENYRVTPLAESGLLTAMTVLMAMIAVYLPFLGFLAALFWSIPIVVLVVRHGLRQGVKSLFVSGILMAILIEPVLALRMVISFGPVGLILGFGIRKSWSGAKVFSWTLAVSVFAKLAGVGLIFALTATNPLELQMVGMRESFDIVMQTYESMGMDQTALQESKAQMAHSMDLIAKLMPLVIVVMGVVDTVLNFYLAAFVLKRLQLPYAWLPPFSGWRLPVAFVYLMGFAMVGTYWGKTRELTMLYEISFNGNMLALLAGMIQGLSFLVFVMKRYHLSRLLQGVLIFLVVTNGLLAQIVAFTGFFDMVMDYRTRFFKKES